MLVDEMFAGRETLLKGNDEFALIGDANGQVRSYGRPQGQSVSVWFGYLESSLRTPAKLWRDMDYAVDVDQERFRVDPETAICICEFKEYCSADLSLSIRAAFLPATRRWVIPEFSDNAPSG